MSKITCLDLAVFLFMLISPIYGQAPPRPQPPESKAPPAPLLEPLHAPTAKALACAWRREVGGYSFGLTFKDGLASCLCRDSKDEKQPTCLTGQSTLGSDGLVFAVYNGRME